MPSKRRIRQPQRGIGGDCKTREVYLRLSERDVMPISKGAVEDKHDKKHYESPLEQRPELGLHGHY